VLAAMLLISGPPGLGRSSGWVVLTSMTLNVVDLVVYLPIGDLARFAAANLRGIAAAAFCLLGLGPVRDAIPGRADPCDGPAEVPTVTLA
jgi:hypothetical protein